jgi:hypothetical protein
MRTDPGEGVLSRQSYCVSKCSMPPGNELAALATRTQFRRATSGVRIMNKFLKPGIKPKRPF